MVFFRPPTTFCHAFPYKQHQHCTPTSKRIFHLFKSLSHCFLVNRCYIYNVNILATICSFTQEQTQWVSQESCDYQRNEGLKWLANECGESLTLKYSILLTFPSDQLYSIINNQMIMSMRTSVLQQGIYP